MQPTYAVASLRENLSTVLAHVHHTGAMIEVTNYRRPYAYIVSNRAGWLLRQLEQPVTRDMATRLLQFLEREIETHTDRTLADCLYAFFQQEAGA